MAKRITFNEDYIQRQYFYLPYPVTQHILWNANAEVLNKLYKTCKHFYKKRPYCIVDEMEMDFEEQVSMKIDGNVFDFGDAGNMEMMDNFWITKKLDGVNQRIISRIARCDAEEIVIDIPSLSLNDFIALTKSGNVEHWYSLITSITDDDENLLPLEKLLFHLPNASHVSFKIQNVNLSSFFVQTRVHFLQLSCHNHLFNADAFFALLKKTLAPNADVFLWLDDQAAVENFQSEMMAKLFAWMPQSEKPSFVVDFDPDDEE